jgi:hypothetical protein
VLVIHVKVGETYDEKRNLFIPEMFRLELEHSLASLSKWESNFEKPFLGKKEKTPDEVLWYIRAMTLTPDVPPEIYYHLSEENVIEINEYIAAPMTATVFNDANQKPNNKPITAEEIYHWMISHQIWLECENWHLNRLLALIRVCNLKNQPQKKMSRKDLIAQRNALNAQRRAQFGTQG